MEQQLENGVLTVKVSGEHEKLSLDFRSKLKGVKSIKVIFQKNTYIKHLELFAEKASITFQSDQKRDYKKEYWNRLYNENHHFDPLKTDYIIDRFENLSKYSKIRVIHANIGLVVGNPKYFDHLSFYACEIKNYYDQILTRTVHNSNELPYDYMNFETCDIKGQFHVENHIAAQQGLYPSYALFENCNYIYKINAENSILFFNNSNVAFLNAYQSIINESFLSNIISAKLEKTNMRGNGMSFLKNVHFKNNNVFLEASDFIDFVCSKEQEDFLMLAQEHFGHKFENSFLFEDMQLFTHDSRCFNPLIKNANLFASYSTVKNPKLEGFSHYISNARTSFIHSNKMTKKIGGSPVLQNWFEDHFKITKLNENDSVTNSYYNSELMRWACSKLPQAIYDSLYGL